MPRAPPKPQSGHRSGNAQRPFRIKPSNVGTLAAWLVFPTGGREQAQRNYDALVAALGRNDRRRALLRAQSCRLLCCGGLGGGLALKLVHRSSTSRVLGGSQEEKSRRAAVYVKRLLSLRQSGGITPFI